MVVEPREILNVMSGCTSITGGDAVQNASKAGPAPSGGVPPPPGPPPPPMPSGQLFADEASSEQSRAKLFAELNKGEDVTKGLKRVTADMQTHKNPSLRTTAAPAPSSSPKPGLAPKPGPVAKAAPEKPPRKELDGKKWMIEYQKNQTNLVISETEMNQVVYIFKCEGSTVQVKGIENLIKV